MHCQVMGARVAMAGRTRYERHSYLLRRSFRLPSSGKVVPSRLLRPGFVRIRIQCRGQRPSERSVDKVVSDIRLFFHPALTREAARSRPARLKWSHLLNTSATTLRRYSLNILKELG